MSSVISVSEKQLSQRTSLGFWVYLMTDCILFASLFATYVVLRTATAGGPSGSEIFEMPLVLAETIILLTSSLTCGIALVMLRQRKIKQMVVAFAATYVLGIAFLTIELSEFIKLISEGYGPDRSAFLSAFFTLVGTHGLHILVGLIWLLTLAVVLSRRGMTTKLSRQITLFGLFWHFLDLVWIFIFTVVYLMGVAV
jgi:cytochrome o ubiquinol oxidase subunit 3